MKGEYDANLSLATGGFDHVIRMWQPSTGKYIQGFQHNESQVNALAFSRDGLYLAAGGYGRVRVYDAHGAATPAVVVSEFTKNVNTLGFNDTGSWMFAGSEDRVAKIIDWREGGNLWITRVYQTSSSINSMLLHRNQHEIIMSTSGGEIIFWDLRNNAANSITPDPEGGPIHSLSIDPDVTSLAAVNSSGQLLVWSLNGNSVWKPLERHRCRVHPTYALKVQFSPDSTLLATCGADGKFKILKTADFSVVTCQKVSPSGLHWVWDCAFSADSRFLLTATSDGIARLWNLETGEVPVEYKGHQRAITCMAFRDQSLS
ncbi:Target of rapamycin complex subunit lst8 [Fasciola hepatica]|uniref:Target of rapamycin complex subunit lst8 n=1 Tax=Fasciola hepatica TaxID=6192 RepID=A0A4E0RSR4_FASHE|nr:Target of rapamycin complex subunit lst8 [Fasciola hepatica]